ncbi:MAG: hypothetical protein US68_C0006G0073 [Candidatus Shapirobacteria bacterium GW2011_GWE1_38_10]|uniref:Uncharacterized protein n=1 Tax=Candidatus Shapirobacteria bacterium GW2011_GWE1_38_10 TaxID=1618488 RepID=A0A0G0I4Y0_9BACT|nr:MAG: hypothetical protein US46_C0002G0106 [Candidatus Shapirobacteria bacterium GW2011_GWF2_37_20]KKQ50393.1 MAG: hypothetical protein US68_C0006G0073 [Candidatus Shapirobacteria bacterium GW2011_GWE1_38_10]KKQ65217.1 MAG: hypothetical protein US85_C0001G0144 [Candidatus Shapirobacteria bacterium GW2011_GWF1_38_23]HBP51206.1 hypothetical protein [Candidatus Shapirobacteria bacterium]
MTTEIEKIIINRDGSEEAFSSTEPMTIVNRIITAEELKKDLEVVIPGLASILDTREATVLEGKKNKKGKRVKFLVDGFATEDNIEGRPKLYVCFAITGKNVEVITRGSVFKDKQTVGLRISRK